MPKFVSDSVQMSRVKLYRIVLQQYVKNAKLNPDEDKASVYDSGFISSEIKSEEWCPEPAQLEEPKQETPKQQHQQQEHMRLDSGVDLISESLSGLSFKSTDQNDLSCSKTKQKDAPPSPPVESEHKQDQDHPWMLYYQQDEEGDTSLHTAIVKGFAEIVLALIRIAPHPLLLDTPNDEALTPIHLATLMGQWKIVRWLIVAGAKPSPRDVNGDSPFHIAARNGDLSCCKAITDPIEEQERSAMALSYTQQPYHQVDLNQWNYEGQTCVHVAAIHGHVDVLRHLVWYGADINAREGRGGYTALHYAIERGDERLAHFLLTECNKLDVEAVTYGGRGALQLGCAVPSKIAEVLKSRGVPAIYDSSDDDYSESDSENDMMYENVYVPSLVNASA